MVFIGFDLLCYGFDFGLDWYGLVGAERAEESVDELVVFGTCEGFCIFDLENYVRKVLLLRLAVEIECFECGFVLRVNP